MNNNYEGLLKTLNTIVKTVDRLEKRSRIQHEWLTDLANEIEELEDTVRHMKDDLEWK
jgi:predicted  nucleic acid-binding Zn-ribbon protein